MDVSSYSPAHSQLNLGSSQTTQYLANSVSPLYYKLTPNDFTTFRIRDETICALDEAIGVALMFTLQRLERHIVDAGHYRILDHISPSPANLRSTQFDELNLPRPSVLLINEFHSRHNPLFFLTNIQDLQSMHASLQLVGQEAMDWISTAKVRAARIGPACSWNFEGQFARPSINPAVQAGIDQRRQPLLIENPVTTQEMVLHPTLSRYARAHIDFDAFRRGEPLIDNGYISGDPCPNTDRQLILHPTASTLARSMGTDGYDAPPPSPATSNSLSIDDEIYMDYSDVDMIDLTLDDDVEMIDLTAA